MYQFSRNQVLGAIEICLFAGTTITTLINDRQPAQDTNNLLIMTSLYRLSFETQLSLQDTSTDSSDRIAPRNSSTPRCRQLRTPHRETPHRMPCLPSPTYHVILTQQTQNRLNILHGGTIASMVDLGGSLAVASRGLFATGVSTDLNGMHAITARDRDDQGKC